MNLLDRGLAVLAAQPPLRLPELALGVAAMGAVAVMAKMASEHTVTSLRGVPLYLSSGAHADGSDSEAEGLYNDYLASIGLEPMQGSFTNWPREQQEVYMDWLQLQRHPAAECVQRVIAGMPWVSCVTQTRRAPWADPDDTHPEMVETVDIELHNVVPPKGQVAARAVMKEALQRYGYDANEILGYASPTFDVVAVPVDKKAGLDTSQVTARMTVTGRELPRRGR